MKFKYALATMAFALLTYVANTQDMQGYPYTGWAYGDGQACENADVQLVVRFINLLDGTEVYKESHNTTSNDRGQFSVDVSKGEVENGEFNSELLTNPRYKMVIDMIIDCDGQEIVVVDRDVRRPRVPVAEVAENWGDQPAPDSEDEPVTLKELLAQTFGFYAPLFLFNEAEPQTGKMDGREMLQEVTPEVLCEHVPLEEEVTPDQVKETLEADPEALQIVTDILGNAFTYGINGLIPVSNYPEQAPMKHNVSSTTTKTGEQLTVISSPESLNKPNVVRSNTNEVEEHESLILYKFLEIGDLFHAFEVFLCLEEEEDQPRTSTNHNTAAIFANNPNGTTGILSNGSGFGSFSQGQNGAFGVTLNEDISGAGVWGTIGFQPSTDNFGYGVLADAQGLTSSQQAWALAIFGDGFTTGEILTLSDQRFKTELRTKPAGLEAVLSLRPAKYTYVQGTSYGLPDGEHYGFMAQEVEDILPELVSEVRLPESRDEHRLSEGSEVIKAVNYTEMIPVLTQAIQELNSKVEQQESEIEVLKELIQELQND